jgi:hypothetical protein
VGVELGGNFVVEVALIELVIVGAELNFFVEESPIVFVLVFVLVFVKPRFLAGQPKAPAE